MNDNGLVNGRNLELDMPSFDIFDASEWPGDRTEGHANAQLISAAPDLLACQTMGASKNTPDFLEWIADRLVGVHGDDAGNDFIISLRERAAAGRNAVAKASCTSNRCPLHPDALVRHSYNLHQYVINGLPAGTGVRSDEKYVCAECGRPLSGDASDYDPA